MALKKKFSDTITSYIWHYCVIVIMGSWPIINFISVNIDVDLDLKTVFLFYLVVIVGSVLVFTTLNFFFPSRYSERLAAVIAITIPIIFSLHVVKRALWFFGFETHLALMVAWTLTLVIACVLASLFCRSARVLRIFTLASGAMLFVPISHIAVAISPLSGVPDNNPTSPTQYDGETAFNKKRKKPDVYYFVIDAYVGSDELKKHTGYDNGEILNWLNKHDFQNLKNARSNYLSTHFSIPSTLSMKPLVTGSPDDPRDLTNFWKIMKGNNPVVRAFKQMGYKYVYSGGDQWCTGIADRCLTADSQFPDELWQLLHMTPLPGALFLISRNIYHEIFTKNRSTDLSTVLNKLSEIKENPHFFFGHILSVHDTPFKADCSYRENLAEEELKRVETDERMTGSVAAYVDTVTCVNGRLKKVVSFILSRNKDAIIVITADHGSAFSKKNIDITKFSSRTVNYLRERTSVFSSWRLPRRCRNLLYDTVSNINHFRIIFSCLSGLKPNYLPDISYIHDAADFNFVRPVPPALLK